MEKRKSESVEPKLNKRLKTLTLPKRVKRNIGTKEETQEIKQDLKTIANTRLLQDDEYYECGVCGEKLIAPYPAPVHRLLKAVRKNEQELKKEQEEKHKQLVEKCKLENLPTPTLIYQKGGLSKNDQQIICRMHKVELIYKPLAKEKGYPTSIDFEGIHARVREMMDDLDKIVNGDIKSEFLDKVLKAHNKLGSIKARQTKELIHRFTETLPGYYGNRGSALILETLNDLYLKTNKIDKEKCDPLTPIEFIQQVLLPEVGSRLIMKDMKLNDLKEAVKVMEESSEYGSVVYNKVKNNSNKKTT